ncbi:10418_t:CDS:1, partial [Funneliformis geosporum]
MCQFKELIDSNSAQLLSSGSLSQQQSSSCHSRLHSSIFGIKAITMNPFSELECYLNPI